MDHSPLGISIFTDSSSSIQAISSTAPSDNESIAEIRELIDSLLSSGTRTSLYWIPSHAGIPGNEATDTLAVNQCSSSPDPTLLTHLSPDEKTAVIKKSWSHDHLRALKNCKKKCIQMRTSFKPIKWHHHPTRKIAISLHRLRSGHNYLNSFNHRIDTGADPSCRFGCEAIENSQHILIDCPKNELARTQLRRLTTTNKIPMDVETLTGLNSSIDTKKQFAIRNLVARFLEKTALTDII
uniref:RNase H type-1 domain-containing protein n=1 Tax=Daphnia galeata TaxID=27404 RepID=A0A8J2RWJ9_9CRUS|nr:unnamed protein product [Daphnia galeata]